MLDQKECLSIVTPTLNSASTIVRLYDSLLPISCLIREWIIVDSFSSDNIFHLSVEFNKTIPTYFEQIPRGGPYNAMNYGIQKSRGQYIWILNSDDFVNSFPLDAFASLLKSQPQIVFGRVLRNYLGQNMLVGTPSFASPMSLRLNEIHPAIIVSRNVYQSIGVFNESYKIAADLDFFLRYYTYWSSRSVHYLQDLVVFFSIGGISTHQDESFTTYCKILINNRVKIKFFTWFLLRKLYSKIKGNSWF